MGATGGLGTAIVDAFASRGDRVIAVARSRAEVSQLASKYPGVVTGDTADLTSRLAVDDLWERIDRVGTPRWVVNATGGYRGGKVVDSTPDDFTFMMDLNLGTAWWSCRAAARRMQAGAIVNVSSRSGLVGRGTPRSMERMSSATPWRLSCSLAAVCSDWSSAAVVADAHFVNASAIAVLACIREVAWALYLSGQQTALSPSL